MGKLFRIIYRTKDDGRRTTSFVEAEQDAYGWHAYLPERLSGKEITLEYVGIIDKDLLPPPTPQSPLTDEQIAWAQSVIRDEQGEA